MKHIYGTPVRIVSTGTVYTGEGFLLSILIGKDGVNDPVVAVYNDTDALTAANKIVPTSTYDASALGIDGVVLKFAKRFTTGLHVTIADLGSGEVIIDYRTQGGLFPHKFV